MRLKNARVLAMSTAALSSRNACAVSPNAEIADALTNLDVAGTTEVTGRELFDETFPIVI
jgi:hypothetical protein